MNKKGKHRVDVIELLPNDEKHRLQLESELTTISETLKKYEIYQCLTNEIKEKYHDYLFYLLTQAGDLSQPAFDIRDKLEKIYMLKYRNDHKKAKKLFLKHYASIHKPYDRIKNNIWKLINITLPNEQQV